MARHVREHCPKPPKAMMRAATMVNFWSFRAMNAIQKSWHTALWLVLPGMQWLQNFRQRLHEQWLRRITSIFAHSLHGLEITEWCRLCECTLFHMSAKCCSQIWNSGYFQSRPSLVSATASHIPGLFCTYQSLELLQSSVIKGVKRRPASQAMQHVCAAVYGLDTWQVLGKEQMHASVTVPMTSGQFLARALKCMQ